MIWKVAVANDANEDSDETAPCAFSITFYLIFFRVLRTHKHYFICKGVGNNTFSTRKTNISAQTCAAIKG